MTHPRLEFAFSRDVSARRLPTRATARLLSAANLGCAGLIILLLITFAIVTLVRGALPAEASVAEVVFGTVFLSAIAALMVRLGLTSRRRIRRAAALDPEGTAPFLLPPYAFAIEGDTVLFPASVDRDGEAWPLAETTASVSRSLGVDAVRLACAGRDTRRFAAEALERSPSRIVALIDEHRRRMEEHPHTPGAADRPHPAA